MAISNADRDLIVNTLLEVFGEDYTSMGRALARLEIRFPAVTWRARLVVLALSYAPFTAARLSIPWWTTEVGRLADRFKG